MSTLTTGVRTGLALVALPLFLSACLTRHERALVDAWLECQDCTDHEADSVRAIGGRWYRRPFLVYALKQDIQAGPSAARRSNVRLQLAESFAADSLYGPGHPRPASSVLPDSPEYLGHYLGSYVATYRIRAAVVVAQVAGPLAVPILGLGADSTKRADVDSAVARLRAGGRP